MAALVFCEDDALIRRMVSVMLRSTGHQIFFAADGREGLTLIERERPVAVFTDRWMPILDGLELCDALKARPEFAALPVILITAALEEDDQQDAYRRGIAAVLKKPFTPADLRALVDRYAPTPETDR